MSQRRKGHTPGVRHEAKVQALSFPHLLFNESSRTVAQPVWLWWRSEAIVLLNQKRIVVPINSDALQTNQKMPRKLLKFLILFDNTSLLYFPGQFLSGRVLIELQDDTPALGKNIWWALSTNQQLSLLHKLRICALIYFMSHKISVITFHVRYF